MSVAATPASGYQSDEDSGDDLFNEQSPVRHQTIPTQPLTAPYQTIPTQPLSTQLSRTNDTQPTFVTQPTQALNTPLHNGDHQAEWRSPSIQVARSSPMRSPSPSRSTGPVPPSLPRGSLNGGILASSMAPPGTAFRAPQQQSQMSQMSRQAQSQTIELSDDEERQISDSSGDEARRKANDIKPTNFSRGNRPLPGNRVEESPRSNFSKFASTFSFQASSSPMKRALAETNAAYSNSSRPNKMPRQDVPSRAMPPQQPDMKVEEIMDYRIRQKVENIQKVLPETSVRKCLRALIHHRSNETDAMNWLVAEEERNELESSTPVMQSTKRNFDTTASINEKYGHLAKPRQDQPPSSTKQQSDLPRKSINEKWSGMSTQQDSREDTQVRRRLVPKKKREPSPLQRSSSPIQPPKQSFNRTRLSESGTDGSESEAEDDQEVVSPALEHKVVNLINESSAADIVDVSGCSKDVVETVLADRPFYSVDTIRAIVVKKAGKTGKMSSRNVGEKLVDACLDTLSGYDAVDRLVRRCEELGREVKITMGTWGLDVSGKSGELDVTSIESSHDSGIGTPSSTGELPADEDAIKPKKSRVLHQPSIMSSELVMKDYQIVGLNWLSLLHSKALSGALCDEMGLGKTCQVIAFLAHLKQTGVEGPHLIIVPGTTIENWFREFRNFCPSLRVEPYYGPKNERPARQIQLTESRDEIDVVITTYDMAWKYEDQKFLRRRIRPHVCVYDEGHYLRNSTTQRYQSLMEIPAKMRLLLTGTPLQNNLQELVSLLAFMMPGLFENLREDLRVIFKHKAKTSDEEHTALLSAERISRAKAMITPFILRRKKRQVLKQLPKKTHVEQLLPMTSFQRKLYFEILPRAKKELKQNGNNGDVSERAKAKSVKTDESSNVLMDLRKAAIHPLLFRRRYTDDILERIAKLFVKTNTGKDKEIVLEDLRVMTDFEIHRFCTDYETHGEIYAKFALQSEAWMDSGKVQGLVSELATNKADGHRTLVFSQFTMVMDILELVFTTHNIPFYRIDGSTDMSNRQELIDSFYEDDTPVFMLSTGAGGTGINLACADRVILFDMSFNPQIDLQAEDRAHRVGQTKEVKVTRLITKDSIEEQIMALAKSKLMLDERVAGEGSDEAEKLGEKKVQEMILKSLEQKPDKSESPAAENESEPESKRRTSPRKKRSAGKDITHRTKAPADLSSKYMDGLKAAGLDMSAADK